MLFFKFTTMKLRGRISEEVKVNDKSVIVQFHGDKEDQYFEVHCTFSPFYHEMKKWDTWDFVLKIKSEIFVDSKTGQKSYFTHLICKRAENRLGVGEVSDGYK